MKYISKAPLRIGLAGGGTDVSPYSDMHHGAILNATIALYATVVLTPRDDNKVVFIAKNNGMRREFEASEVLEDIPELRLQIGAYNHIVKHYAKKPLACEIITDIDVPTGSGLGTSSTLLVAILGSFIEWLKIPLGEYEIARLAVKIEREELKMIGGKQDQYAATFGGFNFMEFYEKNRVIVNPLRIKSEIIKEIEHHLLLFYTKTKRESSNLIEIQRSNFEKNEKDVLEATHRLKEQAYRMKEAILRGELEKIGTILRNGWDNKKQLAKGISNPFIDSIYSKATEAGASGGKISGAGGGGFMIFYCPNNSRFDVVDALKELDVHHQTFKFQQKGLDTWTSYQ